MNAVATPSRFDELEAALSRMPKAEIEIVHHFAPGVYAREARIPAGTMLTGRIHKTEHLNIVQGDISVFNDVDKEAVRITGYHTFVSKPGTRRLGFAHAPTAWITVHPTNETDLAKLEAILIEPHANPLLADVAEKIQ